MHYLWFILFFFIILMPTIKCDVLHDRCVYIDYRGKKLNVSEIGCPKSSICRRTFNISYIQIPPYSGFPLPTTLQKCCGVCTRFRLVNDFPDITKVTLSSIENSDFILPFLGSSTATRLHGYYYIPIISAPNVFYVTTKDKPVLVRLVTDCLQLFPLIIICLLMAVISGFLAWIMETWFNREQFPREFLIGWLDFICLYFQIFLSIFCLVFLPWFSFFFLYRGFFVYQSEWLLKNFYGMASHFGIYFHCKFSLQ